jgi:topoisomerase-4 subunit A
MHSLKELLMVVTKQGGDVVGHTMQYHPHEIKVLVMLWCSGQKELLIDCQGNWGNILTGDGAAASRYIEAFVQVCLCILQKLPIGVFSYDGRRAEPNNLP